MDDLGYSKLDILSDDPEHSTVVAYSVKNIYLHVKFIIQIDSTRKVHI